MCWLILNDNDSFRKYLNLQKSAHRHLDSFSRYLNRYKVEISSSCFHHPHAGCHNASFCSVETCNQFSDDKQFFSHLLLQLIMLLFSQLSQALCGYCESVESVYKINRHFELCIHKLHEKMRHWSLEFPFLILVLLK